MVRTWCHLPNWSGGHQANFVLIVDSLGQEQDCDDRPMSPDSEDTCTREGLKEAEHSQYIMQPVPACPADELPSLKLEEGSDYLRNEKSSPVELIQLNDSVIRELYFICWNRTGCIPIPRGLP